jgi:serine/threonine protein kinase/formylglycine-generating enzyme required for sulfatase activity
LNTQCPDDRDLLLLLDGLLPEARRDEVEAHLDTCADCRRVLGAVDHTRTAPDDRALHLEGAMAAKIDEFELVRRLGRGGMGDVWLARDTLLERDVAIKLGRGAMTDEARSRFLVEARAVARLRHPNILAVHHVGEIEGRPFLVTELLRGRSLEALGQIPPREVVVIGLDLSRALAAAHAAGVLHRDVKPANAFLCDDGTAKLLDFGLAKLTQDPATAAPEDTPDVDLRSGTVDPFDATSPVATGGGVLMGTPLYMAPETWRAEAATRATDVYLLGGLLFTLLAGRAPHAGASLQAVRDAVLAGRLPDLAVAAPDAPAPLVDLVRRCLSLDPDDRPSAEAVCQALQALAAPSDAPVAGDEDPTGNPYRGLLSFGAEHRRLFFGREAETAAVLTELSAVPFVLVVGQSGAGKSSLVRAGVVPSVLAGALGGGEWHVATMLPGDRPVEHLAQALGAFLGEAEGVVLRHLRSSPAWGAERIEQRAGPKRLLLVVDQLEETWTLARPAGRAAFIEALSALASVGREVRLVATLRLDFLRQLEDLGELRAVALRALVVLGPLSSEGLRQAIEEPARLRGVKIDPALTHALVEKAQGAVGMLPLLEFALGVLWEGRREGAAVMTIADLTALGGLEGALAAHADGALGRLGPRLVAEARRILVSLVTVERTRARREEADLVGTSPEARAALGALLDARLVVATVGDEATAYELAHEVLVSGWPALRRWLDEEADAREVVERLRRSVAEWERLGRAAEALWSARQLAELFVLEGRPLPPEAAGFVAESRAAVRRALVRRWALRAGVPLLALLLVASLASVVRWREQRQTRAFVANQIAEADAASREELELDEQIETARAAAFARFDADDRPGGEARWKEARGLSRRASDTFTRASIHLGQALAGDPLDAAARARAADLTYRWLLAAERDHDAELARDLEGRLARLDDDGSRRARLAAPAHLHVTTDPPGASVVLHAVHVDAKLRRVEDEGYPIALGASIELAPGSYVLAASAPGSYPTRLPVLLGRGGALEVEIPLPASAHVPPGLVFVPAGTSLLGGPDVEWIRGALSSVDPEHPVEVEAFLIGVYEVTFAEYLEFLMSLPAAERALRRPHATGLDLGYDPEGTPILTLGKVTARRGEPFCRPKRSERRCQDWLRFPVAGISVEDAQAYVEWLASGRLPGARRCTEREWERAARGADGRLYAHGDAPWPGDANFDETYRFDADMMGADEVGSFPTDRSPFGVLDLGGNVREWVAPKAGRMARGGDWLGFSVDARADYRNVPPDDRGDYLGLRVCASVPRTRGRR